MARLGKFREAIADYQRAAELAPQDHLHWHDGFMPLLLEVRDVEGYRHWRSEELRRFRNTSQELAAHRVAKDACMLPLDGEDLKIAVELADKALTDQTKGMAEYRSRHYARAIAYMIRSRERTGDRRFIAENEFFVAMSCQQLGDNRQARAALQRGIESLARLSNADAGCLGTRNPCEWVLWRLLRQEAETLINAKQPATNPSTEPAAAEWKTLRELFEHEVEALDGELGQGDAKGAEQLYDIRAGLYARLGRFQEAADDYAKGD